MTIKRDIAKLSPYVHHSISGTSHALRCRTNRPVPGTSTIRWSNKVISAGGVRTCEEDMGHRRSWSSLQGGGFSAGAILLSLVLLVALSVNSQGVVGGTPLHADTRPTVPQDGDFSGIELYSSALMKENNGGREEISSHTPDFRGGFKESERNLTLTDTRNILTKPLNRLSKRDAIRISNWGSNPYLIGKRRLLNPQFWAARGKKSYDNTIPQSPDYDSYDYYSNYGDFKSPDELRPLNIPSYPYAYPAYLTEQISLPRNSTVDVDDGVEYEEPTSNKLNIRYQNGNEDHLVNGEKVNKRALPKVLSVLTKESAGGEGKKKDPSKFWMSRGRRFWAARGKKMTTSPIFSRLARLVDSSQNEVNGLYFNEEPSDDSLEISGRPPAFGSTLGMNQDKYMYNNPNFWAVRGKKSRPYMNSGARTPFDRISALAHLNDRGFQSPNFWANRGRKNFWAARG